MTGEDSNLLIPVLWAVQVGDALCLELPERGRWALMRRNQSQPCTGGLGVWRPSDRLAPPARDEQDKEQDNFCAIPGESDRNKDANGRLRQMLNTGSDSVLGPNGSPVQTNVGNRTDI
jgi:hypothetical protein